MSVAKKAVAKTGEKADLRNKIEQLITAALQGLKSEIGEKKFEKRIHKAAKLIGKGSDKPKTPAVKKVATKATASATKKSSTPKKSAAPKKGAAIKKTAAKK